jgi:hypothetical protein
MRAWAGAGTAIRTANIANVIRRIGCVSAAVSPELKLLAHQRPDVCALYREPGISYERFRKSAQRFSD